MFYEIGIREHFYFEEESGVDTCDFAACGCSGTRSPPGIHTISLASSDDAARSPEVECAILSHPHNEALNCI